MNKPSPCPSTCEFPSYSGNGNDTSLLVSPLLVAGVVIGLVLFLSCVTIIVGSLRKDGRLRHPYMRRDANYAPDGFSYSGSIGELRSTCIEEFPPAFDFGSYMDTLSQNVFSFSYDECVGPGATQIYIPTDDPPPYSLRDPCRRNDFSINITHGGKQSPVVGAFQPLVALQPPPSQLLIASAATGGKEKSSRPSACPCNPAGGHQEPLPRGASPHKGPPAWSSPRELRVILLLLNCLP
uniref:Protein BEAN1-like n=1 Tax=Crocodylus porosus TaxID=8502 RepID=A0A7M4EDT3_CROPO